MKRHQHRIFPLLASTVAAAALLAPPASAASDPSNGTLRNDIAHQGRQSPAQRPSKTVLNDNAHNGNERVLSTQQSTAPIVVRLDGGFDWISAAVGAAGGFGLLLVAGVATSTLRRRHGVDPAQA
jgi:hypothetical protein